MREGQGGGRPVSLSQAFFKAKVQINVMEETHLSTSFFVANEIFFRMLNGQAWNRPCFYVGVFCPTQEPIIPYFTGHVSH